jgi:hypothetical protein
MKAKYQSDKFLIRLSRELQRANEGLLRASPVDRQAARELRDRAKWHLDAYRQAASKLSDRERCYAAKFDWPATALLKIRGAYPSRVYQTALAADKPLPPLGDQQPAVPVRPVGRLRVVRGIDVGLCTQIVR